MYISWKPYSFVPITPCLFSHDLSVLYLPTIPSPAMCNSPHDARSEADSWPGWHSIILLMDKILHHLGWLKPYQQWDNHHPWWCRILSINSISGQIMTGWWLNQPIQVASVGRSGGKRSDVILPGGWTNPSEEYARQNGFMFPQFSGWKYQNISSCHHLDIISPTWILLKQGGMSLSLLPINPIKMGWGRVRSL